ncbi:hypothetical protein K469DRAFT_73097 [Zopfia rhizophila CBS 207.26]|uniref:Uncharacterized protein n=1 Tax=Zopfia rhizophila CBS 207.26 TaxID=1314779 RepID=A0A6A6EDR3_9PEZI|nr:hypothetical protein K469DRAFT_73097 [Zopfia rhizophila CBS 207.26]
MPHNKFLLTPNYPNNAPGEFANLPSSLSPFPDPLTPPNSHLPPLLPIPRRLPLNTAPLIALRPLHIIIPSNFLPLLSTSTPSKLNKRILRVIRLQNRTRGLVYCF